MQLRLGLALGTILQPGAGVDLGSATELKAVEPQPFSETLVNIIPTNPVQAMADAQVLQIIVLPFYLVSL